MGPEEMPPAAGSASAAEPALPDSAIPSPPQSNDSDAEDDTRARLEAELRELSSLLKDTPALGFLKPRIAQLAGDGLNYQQLISLYRIISRMFRDDLARKTQSLTSVEEDFSKLQSRSESMRKELAGMAASARVAAAAEKTFAEADLLPSLRAELEKKDKEVQESSTRLDSMQQDFQNYRNRVKLDMELNLHRAREDWMRKILGVIDNFERALNSSREPSAISSLLQGIELIQSQMLDILAGEGVVQIATEGEPFDPKLHDALMHEVTAEHPDDTVLKELQKGYTIGGKVLRPAMVQVSRLPPGATYEPPAEAKPPSDPKRSPVLAAADETKVDSPKSMSESDAPTPVTPAAKSEEKLATDGATVPDLDVTAAVPGLSLDGVEVPEVVQFEEMPLEHALTEIKAGGGTPPGAEEESAPCDVLAPLLSAPSHRADPTEAELDEWFSHRLGKK